MIMATHGVVSSGHYLATGIGIDILRRGGNAMDAAAAVGFALTVTKPHQNGICGEVPMLIYSARDRHVSALSGHGVAPAAATLKRFKEMGVTIIPGDGFLPAVVPPAVASWILLLERFGTMRLADVLSPAVDLAENGFPMYDHLCSSITASADRFRREWPSSAANWLVSNEPPRSGAVFKQGDWGATMKRLIKAEGRHKQRLKGLRAAYDEFYRGWIAERIVEFAGKTEILDASGKAHAGLLTVDDFARYKPKVEEPVTATYRGIDVHKCSSWTQGPVLLQALNTLEYFDLASMGHNSADYIHTIVECAKLAYADREFFYGDPDFVEMPWDRLLCKDYAHERRGLVDPRTASMLLRPGGMPHVKALSVADVNAVFEKGKAHVSDTTKLEVIDAAGNMVSATPSGGWLPSSPVIPGLGFPLGTRGQMFSLVEGHPNALAPGKRPRSTLTPSMATRGNEPWLVFGSPGGDAQDQWALQFFLNVVEFGMSLQEAVEAPTFWTNHFPSSFYPRKAEPGSLHIEGRIGAPVRDELASRGHLVDTAGEWAGGNTLAASIDRKAGVLCAAASPRLEPAYADGF